MSTTQTDAGREQEPTRDELDPASTRASHVTKSLPEHYSVECFGFQTMYGNTEVIPKIHEIRNFFHEPANLLHFEDPTVWTPEVTKDNIDMQH
jgi:hypothetical protein